MDWMLLAKIAALTITMIVMVIAMGSGYAAVATGLVWVARGIVKKF